MGAGAADAAADAVFDAGTSDVPSAGTALTVSSGAGDRLSARPGPAFQPNDGTGSSADLTVVVDPNVSFSKRGWSA